MNKQIGHVISDVRQLRVSQGESKRPPKSAFRLRFIDSMLCSMFRSRRGFVSERVEAEEEEEDGFVVIAVKKSPSRPRAKTQYQKSPFRDQRSGEMRINERKQRSAATETAFRSRSAHETRRNHFETPKETSSNGITVADVPFRLSKEFLGSREGFRNINLRPIDSQYFSYDFALENQIVASMD